MFIIALPYAKDLVVKGWGFWASSIKIDWIGPRHTNFTDGSICAFEQSDGTWAKGAPIVQLLDLYSLWAFRHLHMNTFGRWPGYQAIHFPYERVLEVRPDEHCGCDNSELLYRECCQKKDRNRNLIGDAVNFVIRCSGGHREPPAKVINFIRDDEIPSLITELL